MTRPILPMPPPVECAHLPSKPPSPSTELPTRSSALCPSRGQSNPLSIHACGAAVPAPISSTPIPRAKGRGGGGRGGCAHNRPHSPHTRGGLRESAGIVVPHQRQPLRYSGLCGNLGLHYDSCRFPPPSQGSIACCMLNCMNCMNCMLYADVDTLPASRHHPSAAVPSTPSQFHFQTFRQTTSHSPAGNHVAGITGQTASLTGHAHRCMTHSNQITSQRSNGAHMARCSDRHDGRCPLHAAKPFPARMPASVPNNPCVCSNCCR